MYTHNYFPTYLPTSLSLSLSPYRTLPTLPYVAAFLPTHLLACLPSYLPADLPAFLPTCMGTVTSATQPCSYLLAGKRPTYQAICVDAHDIPTYLPTYIHTYSHTYIHTYIPPCIHTLLLLLPNILLLFPCVSTWGELALLPHASNARSCVLDSL